MDKLIQRQVYLLRTARYRKIRTKWSNGLQCSILKPGICYSSVMNLYVVIKPYNGYKKSKIRRIKLPEAVPSLA